MDGTTPDGLTGMRGYSAGQMALSGGSTVAACERGHVLPSFLDGETALVTFLFLFCFFKKRTRSLSMSQGHFKNTSKGYNQVMETLNIIKDITKIFTKIFTKASLKIIDLHTEHHAVRKNLNNGTKGEKRGVRRLAASQGGLCGHEDSGWAGVEETWECWRPPATEPGKRWTLMPTAWGSSKDDATNRQMAPLMLGRGHRGA